MGAQPFGIDMATLDALAGDIAEAVAEGFELCLVVGGGNIFRGVSMAGKGMERASADYMGMLATVMNALAVQSALERRGVSHPGAVGHPDGSGLRALHPPPRAAASGEGQGGDLRRRPRRALLHHRHAGRACGRPRWAATPCSRAPASTASTRPIPRPTRTPDATIA